MINMLMFLKNQHMNKLPACKQQTVLFREITRLEKLLTNMQMTVSR